MIYIKLTKNFPPAHYDVTNDWAKPEMFATTQGKHRGCFLKAPRITSSEAAMKFAIKRGVPACVEAHAERLNYTTCRLHQSAR